MTDKRKSPNPNNSIWFYQKGEYKCYSKDLKLLNRIESWILVDSGAYYYESGNLFARDLIFPSKLYNRVAKALGLPLRKKNKNRSEGGLRYRGNLPNSSG